MLVGQSGVDPHRFAEGIKLFNSAEFFEAEAVNGVISSMARGAGRWSARTSAAADLIPGTDGHPFALRLAVPYLNPEVLCPDARIFLS